MGTLFFTFIPTGDAGGPTSSHGGIWWPGCRKRLNEARAAPAQVTLAKLQRPSIQLLLLGGAPQSAANVRQARCDCFCGCTTPWPRRCTEPYPCMLSGGSVLILAALAARKYAGAEDTCGRAADCPASTAKEARSERSVSEKCSGLLLRFVSSFSCRLASCPRALLPFL